MNTARHSINWEWRPPTDFGQARGGQQGPELTRIGKRMRALYEQIGEEPIPDGLLNLLKQLGNRSA
jgi:hypothetical protein